MLGFTRLQKSSFWVIFLILSILKIATALISISQFENANEINFQNQISRIFRIFQNFQIFSCPWARPGRRSIFSPEMFQKLRLAESESTYPTVGLDKRKSQTNIRISSEEPKRQKSEPKKVGPRFSQFGAGHHRAVLLYKPVLRNRLYKPYWIRITNPNYYEFQK